MMKSYIKKVMYATLTAGLLIPLLSAPAQATENLSATTVDSKIPTNAADSRVTSGIYGTSQYYLTTSGELHFGTGAFPDNWSIAHLGRDVAQKTKKIIFDGPIVLPANSSFLFSTLSALTTIEHLDRLDTSHVTNMSEMFSLTDLTSLDLQSWDTTNVTNMAGMFSDSNLTSANLNINNWDTSNVVNMAEMFADNQKLTTVDISKWNTANVVNMAGMFENCYSLSDLKINNWNTGNVVDMSTMFANAQALTILDLQSWDTANVRDMAMMFADDTSLTSLNLGNWHTEQARSMRAMFSGATSLVSLDLSSFKTNQMTDMSYMFAGATNLMSLNLSQFNTAQVTDMARAFDNDAQLQKLVLSKDFSFQKDAYLPEHNANNQYTALWQNVGSGSEQSPAGDRVWTAAQLIANYEGSKDVDTYVWQPVGTQHTSLVTVKYVDENNNQITDDVVKSGNIGDKYTTDQKDIDGYTFQKIQGNQSGTFTDENQTIVYIYTKNKVVTPGDSSTPADPDKNTDKNISNNNPTHKSNQTAVKHQQMLPQTGENQRDVSLATSIGVVLLTIVSLLFYIKPKKSN